MDTITYSAARENLAQTIHKVCRDRTPIIITRGRTESAVLLSLEDYHSMEETAYLLRSPANARRLMEAKEAIEKGLGVTIDPATLE